MINEIALKEFKEQLNKIINDALDARDFAKQNDLINSQEYLDFEDKLNTISTMDPRA